MNTTFLHENTTGRAIKGYACLPDGSTAIILDDGRVLTGKHLMLLDDWKSEQLRAELCISLSSHRTALTALRASKDTGIRERIDNRRAATVRRRDRNVVAVIGDDVPTFTAIATGTGMTDVDRRARTERLAREIPDV